MTTTKWSFRKEWSFASNYFIFFGKFVPTLESLKELIWCTNDPNVHSRIFRKCLSLILGCFFPVSILKSYAITSAGIRTEVTDIIIFVLFLITITALTLTTTLILINSWLQKNLLLNSISFSVSSIHKFLTIFPLTSAGLQINAAF